MDSIGLKPRKRAHNQKYRAKGQPVTVYLSGENLAYLEAVKRKHPQVTASAFVNSVLDLVRATRS